MSATINHGEFVTEVEPHHFVAEASDLQLPPGTFPSVLTTTLGNRQPLRAVHVEKRDGDLMWIDYHQDLGCVSLRIFND